MNKFLVNLLCTLMPKKSWRHKIRAKLLSSSSTRFQNIIENIKFEAEKTRYVNLVYTLAGRTHPETFGKYKNCFAENDVVLVAPGPSLTQFIPMENVIYVGINSSAKYDRVKMQYLFFVDYANPNLSIEKAKNYPAVKFYGIVRPFFKFENRYPVIPESIIAQHSALKYYSISVKDLMIKENLDFAYDLTCQPLTTYASIAFHAMQFILWGNPRRVYLVGCDVTNSGHFDNSKTNILCTDTVMLGWRKLKEFRDTYYPETEIISINPIGLKGVFDQDIYQKDKDQVIVS